ncbi:MAG: hypothetical protein DSY70_03935 [Desulfobulbus sp.]|nr:MAG: hypothetical protein DSY70_03935 [Desulfobulbus sp.]
MNILVRYCVVSSGVGFIMLSSYRVEAHWTVLSDRLQLTPIIQTVVQQSDNVFHVPEKTHSDLVTAIRPKLLSEAALTDTLFCSLEYTGDFRHYWNFDNLDSIRHKGELQIKMTTPRGSKFAIGTRYYDSTIQAFSQKGDNRDYVEREVYFDSLFTTGSWTEAGLRFESSYRDFDDDHWRTDDYDRYAVKGYVAYKRLPFTSFIGEYNFSHQENDDFAGGPLEIDAHSILFGPEWQAGKRLSGKLLGGYSWISGNTLSDSSSFSFLANLHYKFSPFTSFNLDGFHAYNTSTSANRETNIYNVSKGGTFTIDYTRWKPFHVIAVLEYKNQEFKGEGESIVSRTDDFYKASLRIQYPLRNWLLLEAKYALNKKDSDLSSVEYRENVGALNLTFSF